MTARLRGQLAAGVARPGAALPVSGADDRVRFAGSRRSVLTFPRAAACSAQYRRDLPRLASMKTWPHDAIAQMPSLLTPTTDTVSATLMIAAAANRSPIEPCEARWTCQRWSLSWRAISGWMGNWISSALSRAIARWSSPVAAAVKMVWNSARTCRSTSRSRRVTGPSRQSPSALMHAVGEPSGSGAPASCTAVLARRTARSAYDDRFTTVLTLSWTTRRPLPRKRVLHSRDYGGGVLF